LEGANRGAVFKLLLDTNRVGREGSCEVVLVDGAASRHHAEISWGVDEKAFRFRDLDSQNGTLINGLPSREARLSQGDELRVGTTVLVFVEGDQEPVVGTGASTICIRPSKIAPKAMSAPVVLERAPQLIGESKPFRELLEATARCARVESPVLLLGESGTGKELLAQAIHRASPRREGPLVSINAATLTGNLSESELFGHERGAFTGAAARRAGCLERANGGTLFLDEVGELPLDTQAKLLRALETKRFCRLGGTAEIQSDFRLVAATHRDLHEAVDEGTFREDLLYRLDVARLSVPPLRERPGDIQLLARHFVTTLAHKLGSKVQALTQDALDGLTVHPFPGNVRELKNTIERGLIFATGVELTLGDLTLRPPRAKETGGSDADRPVVPLLDLERREIEHALAKTGGNKTQAALLLGIDRKTLYAKIERHGLDT
jgi:transcriptional regulator with PAS, ATPase and Fis domain